MRHEKDKYHNQTKGIKPKNRVYCAESMRPKMKFETEKEARDFIRWNHDNFDEKIPSRVYWCDACCGYHITAKPENGVGVAINMKLPYLTEALEKDKPRVMHAVKSIYKVLNILKHPLGYYGKIGLGICKSILDGLEYSKNPYYLDERKELTKIVDEQRQQYKPVWMKRKYCRLIKTKLYRALCDSEHDEDYNTGTYKYNLAYILYLAQNDNYDISGLPELFLDEWETLFQASPISKYLIDKMTIDNGTDKEHQTEEALDETEEHVPRIQNGSQSQGL